MEKQDTPTSRKREGKKEHGDDHPDEAAVTFKLTGAGSALVETQFPGMPHEMVSVYHLDGKELRMTHYCAAGNQPRVKLDRAKSTPDELIFVFDGGTNLDPEKDMHIHGVKNQVREGRQGQQRVGRICRRQEGVDYHVRHDPKQRRERSASPH